MKIINNVIECVCGCKFEYEVNDIWQNTNNGFPTTAVSNYDKYVICPIGGTRHLLGHGMFNDLSIYKGGLNNERHRSTRTH